MEKKLDMILNRLGDLDVIKQELQTLNTRVASLEDGQKALEDGQKALEAGQKEIKESISELPYIKQAVLDTNEIVKRIEATPIHHDVERMNQLETDVKLIKRVLTNQ